MALPDLLGFLLESPGASVRQIEELAETTDHKREPIRGALRLAVRSGWVTVADGKRRAKLHTLTDVAPIDRAPPPLDPQTELL